MDRVVSLLTALALACAPGTAVRAQTWARIIDGVDGEAPLAIDERVPGELVLAAWTDSIGTQTGDSWRFGLDAQGAVTEVALLGDPDPGGADGAVIASDGGVVFVGRNVVDIFLKQDAWVMRMDSAGGLIWGTLIGWVGFGRTFLADVAEAAGGGWLVTGTSAMNDFPPQDLLFAKLDDSGDVLWMRQFGSGVSDTPSSIVATADRGWIVAGNTTFGGDADALVAKFDDLATIEWQVQVGGDDADAAEEIIALSSGGYAVAGATQSFTASGRAPWLMRFDDAGALLWHQVFGDQDWGDLQSLVETSDGNIVALGRVAEPGFPTNDLWAVKVAASDGAVLWQRAYEGDSGDYADAIAELSDGALLMAGTWGWGFPEEALWLLRTDPAGLLTDCGFVRDTTLVAGSPMLTVTAGPLAQRPLSVDSLPQGFVAGAGPFAERELCGAAACAPLSCDDLLIEPGPRCEERLYSLTAFTTGGEGALDVAWDVDGDTLPDVVGNPAQVLLPVGMQTITALVSDSCTLPGAQDCTLSLPVDVPADPPPPGEVSDVEGGEPALLVSESGRRLGFEWEGLAEAFNVHVGLIGSWYEPSPGGETQCHRLDAVDPGDGTAAVDVDLPAGSWVLVTASDACFEGPAGTDSFGAGRAAAPTWLACGPLP